LNEVRSVLITGGAGFIGSHLADSLVADGVEVWALDDLSTGSLRNVRHLLDRPEFHFESGSVLDAELCRRLVAGVDQVFHLAAAVGVRLVFRQPVETIERNVRGTENVLAACLEHGAKVFLASTSEVYGKDMPNGSEPFRETDAITLGPSIRWCYACSKALDEYLARAMAASKGLPVVIGRLFNTVGPRQTGAYGMVIPRFVRWALDGRPLQVYGDGQQKRTFVHVDDAVRAIRALMAEPKAEGEVVNIGSDEVVTIADLAARVLTAAGSASEIVAVRYEEVFGDGFDDIRHRVPDLGKLRRLIGFQPRHRLDAILRDAVEHARSEDPSP